MKTIVKTSSAEGWSSWLGGQDMGWSQEACLLTGTDLRVEGAGQALGVAPNLWTQGSSDTSALENRDGAWPHWP